MDLRPFFSPSGSLSCSTFRAALSRFPVWQGGWVLLVHLTLSCTGFVCLPTGDFVQIVQHQFPPGAPFGEILWAFHGNPPLLSCLHALATLCGPWFFEVSMPLLHAGAGFLFFSGAIFRGFRMPGWLWLLLFLNPMVVLGFRLPTYTPVLFFLAAWIWAELGRHSVSPRRSTLRLAALLGFAALWRASWHPLLFLPGLLWLWPASGRTSSWKVLLPFLPVFLWMAKNFWLVGSFTTSTWLGMNLHRSHHAWDQHGHRIDFLPPFSPPDSAFRLFADDPLVQGFRSETRYGLSQNNLNHRVVPHLSALYLGSIRDQFSGSWTVQVALNGVLIFFQSPSASPQWRELWGRYWRWNPGWFQADFWDPVSRNPPDYLVRFWGNAGFDPGRTRIEVWKRVSVYTLLYPLLVVLFGRRWPSFLVADQVLFGWVLSLRAVYCLADVQEANRMRLELEPWFWGLGWLVFCRPGTRADRGGTRGIR